MTGNRPSFEERPIPDRAGVGLKPEHYRTILESWPDIGWFEVHAENYMGAGGPPHYYLTAIRERYPLSVHGVGLSIGSFRPLDKGHLARLKAVCGRYQPGLVSEHLAWSSHEGSYLNDLLPIPYTDETLQRVADHVDEVQETLGRRVLIENPSTYVRFEASEMGEADFLIELIRRTGCGLLLDVNNVFVSASNHGFDAEAYIAALPMAHVCEIHLGGHAGDQDGTGAELLIDAHGSRVCDAVWALYERTLISAGRTPTLVEWDNDVPPWPVLCNEAQRADRLLADRGGWHAGIA